MTALGTQHKNDYVARREAANLVRWCVGAVSLLSLILNLISLTRWRKEGQPVKLPWNGSIMQLL